jgi:outer membrane protein
LAETNVLIAEKDLKIAKGALQPRLSAFYGYSSRISYSDRLEGTGLYEILPTGLFVEGSLNQVLRYSEVTRVIGPAAFEDQFKDNAGQNFGVQLSIPILNGFSVRNNVARNKINVERSKYAFEQQKLDLENTINQAHNNVQSAFKAYDAAQKTLQAREKAFSYAKDRFDLGVVNSFEYSQAKQRFELAQSEVIRTKYDYIFKLKVLEFYFGIPIKID